MRIFIQRHSLESIALQCDVLDTVFSIKAQFQARKGFPADQAGLTFSNGLWTGQLQDHRTLEHYNIHNDSTLLLVHRHKQAAALPVVSACRGFTASALTEGKDRVKGHQQTKAAREHQSQLGNSRWALAARRVLELEKSAKNKAEWDLLLYGGGACAAAAAAPTPPSTPELRSCVVAQFTP